MEPKIIFEDDSIIVVDKPAGMIVHPSTDSTNAHGHSERSRRAKSSGQVRDDSLSHWLENRELRIKNEEWPDKSRPGIVHRLDQDTSGTIVLAKTPKVLEKLQESFKEHQIKKIYWAIVFGHPDPGQGSIDVAIGRHPDRKTPMTVIPVAEIARGNVREASTDYRVLEKYRDAALIEATLHTGRTHQIRLHMKYLGHPILGDTTYGIKPSQRLSKSLGITRQMLHAKTLGFPHPKTGEWVEYSSDLPSDFQNAISRLNHS